VVAEVAARRDGTILAMRLDDLVPVGAFSMYPRSSVVESGQILRTTPGPYRFRDYEARGRVVFQNKTPMSQYRAVGHPVAALVMEAMVDRVARDLGLDPVEVRRRNLLTADMSVLASVTEQGQGTDTILAQVAAATVGVAIEDVRVVTGDTMVTPYGGGTWGSRGAGIGGEATLLTGKALKENILKVAALVLEVDPLALDVQDGTSSTRPRASAACRSPSWAGSPISVLTRCPRTSSRS
jgi:CO/xanthine dehydrogenase Mo-binding subunit